jgi:F-type H+-transporting ATPase subunit delta
MAGRYATALFELARDARALDAVRADLDAFEKLIDQNPDLARLIASPVFSANEQTNALSSVLDRAGISGLTANFLLFVARKRRLLSARLMIRAFRALLARHRGEVQAQVTVAEPLAARHAEALKDALKNVTGGRQVDLDVRVDPSIIGGMTVKVGSRMVDSSLRTKLNQIKLAMKEAR